MHQDQNTATTSDAVTDPSVERAVRQALADHGRLTVDAAEVAPTADLYTLGLTSHATVNVMLAVENDLDAEFPDSVLNRATFASVDGIVAAAALATS
ncbi:acyl carrier protein [Curtobacterium sp. VKM Ac-2922]|uniref:acyl carrier protein n=1 Tax=Curtobacterium sp. VKM Ac-2922 TaxID=2929475 RepID=UPI001FB2E05D|nr:acyl carrier protein [Curtobacterium sp. VKM Ac-2922]MCJ1712565.1 acyl carrier protein [Curtobacterium sp. VKM Ac-2922]